MLALVIQGVALYRHPRPLPCKWAIVRLTLETPRLAPCAVFSAGAKIIDLEILTRAAQAPARVKITLNNLKRNQPPASLGAFGIARRAIRPKLRNFWEKIRPKLRNFWEKIRPRLRNFFAESRRRAQSFQGAKKSRVF